MIRARSELKSRHCGMDPLEQWPLQVGNRISETHFAEWGSVLEPARADLADSVTLRAMHANEYHAAAYRRRRRLRDSGFNGAQQNCSPTSSLDHLVGECEQLVGKGETERFGGLQVEHEIDLVGCWTGIAAGFVPCKILSTKSAAWRHMSGQFGP